jgi:tetratricopeptide (TPR) repeat protein
MAAADHEHACVQVLYSNRAQAYISMQRFEAAIQDCEASLRSKFSVKAALRRGAACEALGLWAEACDSFRAVLQREPHNFQARSSLTECEAALADASAAALPADVPTEGSML